jgi:signal transduction histidine kinase
VSGDRHLLARAIINLLGNAVKFSPQGAAVELTCERHERVAQIQVSDQGPGIDPARRENLFQRFSRRVHRGGADPGGGGLGLAFVRVVAEKHNGEATVELGGEPGTRFRLCVPLAELGRAM